MTLFGASCATPGSASHTRLSCPTGVPESKHVEKAARYAIIDVVAHTGQIHTTRALDTTATRWSAYAGLRRQHREHLGDIVVNCAGCRGSVPFPPACGLFDLSEGLRGDPNLKRRTQPARRSRSRSCSPDTNSPRSICRIDSSSSSSSCRFALSRPHFLGSRTTLVGAGAFLSGASAFLKRPGETFQCSPVSVMTVTVFRLYRVTIPVRSGRPSG